LKCCCPYHLPVPLKGWWSWLSGVTDNSIYPVMLADNLRLFMPSLGGGWQR
jgi:hypothetical protein